MSDPAAADAMASVAAAVTGPGTPESAAVSAKPTEWAVRMLALAGPALSVMVAWVIIIVGGSGLGVFGLTVLAPTLWPDDVAEWRIKGLVAIALALCAILAVVVFRLASGGLKRIEAKAGPASMTVSTDN